jgi:mannose-6-phosphate isomerase-like protein (cupin superfamily)
MELLTRGRFARPVQRDAVARDWRARGYDCRPFVDPPGQEWNGFVHRSNELVTVLEGRLQCEVSGERVRLEEGDELFIPRDAVHSLKNVHGGTTRWLFGYDEKPSQA